MSLFRKPTKRIQRRVFTADDDEEDGEPEPPPPPIISRKEIKPAKIKTKSLLSFADEEEEDGEVFQVKKSSQSKKLKKKREKEKLRGPDGDSNKYDNNVIEVKDEPDQNDKPKKNKVTLEGLILAGREAVSADGAGDVSDEGGAGSDEEDSRGFHHYRPERVRAALAVAPGHIPDAALIHAARKTRQQARELGDFVPVGPSEDKSESKRSRLVREDGSGDEDDEGRIQVVGLEMPSDKPKRGTCAAPSIEELESDEGETATWEDQQMQKAMPAIAERSGEGIEVNPFAICPAPPRMADAPPHLRPLAPGMAPPTTAAQMMDLLTERLNSLKAERAITAAKASEVRERLLTADRTRENRAARTSDLDATYRRAQAIRGYLTDLVECLDEKMPQLEALEAKALALHKRRCEFLIERRRADVRDQAHEVLTGGRRAGGVAGEDNAAVRRAAEREGRRRARRLRREATGAATTHRDGDSSDDDLPPDLAATLAQQHEEISGAAANLFADALPAWRSVSGVCGKLARFRRAQPAAYLDAYIPDSLPRILAPYIRHQLILWNPLADENNEDWEKMDWYKCLMMYGIRDDKMAISDDSDASDDAIDGYPVDITEDSVREDPDLMLVPTIVNKVVLPKITEVVMSAWDPVCVRSSVRLRGAVCRLLPAAAPRELRRLDRAVAARLADAISNDAFLPALPPHVAEGAGGGFWRRCLGGGVRLLRSLLALTAPPRGLGGAALVLRLLAALCAGAGAAPGALGSLAARELAAPLPRRPALRRPALQLLARLAAAALRRLHDHPLHLKAIEQARSIIAEAKALADEQCDS